MDQQHTPFETLLFVLLIWVINKKHLGFIKTKTVIPESHFPWWKQFKVYTRTFAKWQVFGKLFCNKVNFHKENKKTRYINVYREVGVLYVFRVYMIFIAAFKIVSLSNIPTTNLTIWVDMYSSDTSCILLSLVTNKISPKYILWTSRSYSSW